MLIAEPRFQEFLGRGVAERGMLSLPVVSQSRSAGFPTASPGAKAADADGQNITHHGQRIGLALRVDPSIPHSASFAKYAVAFFRVATSILSRALSARIRDIYICSGVTTLVPAPLSFPASNVLTQLRKVWSLTPGSFATTPLLCPSFTRFTASSLNSAVYSSFGNFFILSLPSKLNRVIPLPLENEISGGAHEQVMPVLEPIFFELESKSAKGLSYFLHDDLEYPVVEYLRRRGLHFRLVDGLPKVLSEGYRSMDFVVSQMLHSSILAFSVGTPAINIAYDLKSAAFFELFNLSEYSIPWNQLNHERLRYSMDRMRYSLQEVKATIAERRTDLLTEQERFLSRVISLVGQD